jgi:hypothetical protein
MRGKRDLILPRQKNIISEARKREELEQKVKLMH